MCKTEPQAAHAHLSHIHESCDLPGLPWSQMNKQGHTAMLINPLQDGAQFPMKGTTAQGPSTQELTLLLILTRWYRCSGNGFRGMKRPMPLLTLMFPSSKTILPWLMTTRGEPWHSMPSKMLYSTVCECKKPRVNLCTTPKVSPASTWHTYDAVL